MKGGYFYMEATNQQNQETLISWIKALSKSGLKTLPAMAKTIIIQIVIVLAFQLIFWWVSMVC